MIQDRSKGNKFLGKFSRVIKKSKPRQIEVYETKKPLHNKRTQECEKTSYGMGRNLGEYSSDKGLISRMYMNLNNTNKIILF